MAESSMPANPVLRYLAILSAARDFGLSRAQIARVGGRFDPLTVDPGELADALVDALLQVRPSGLHWQLPR